MRIALLIILTSICAQAQVEKYKVEAIICEHTGNRYAAIVPPGAMTITQDSLYIYNKITDVNPSEVYPIRSRYDQLDEKVTIISDMMGNKFELLQRKGVGIIKWKKEDGHIVNLVIDKIE